MLNLEKHINDLFYIYDCVIIPGLGGFVANEKGAELNEETGVFSPPKREIVFNKNLSHNDGLLINHIATAEGISFESCNNKLSSHINSLKYKLERGENILIGSAGELKIDLEGNTIFTPNKEESFSTESFGLTTFHFNTLDQLKEQNAPTRQLVRRTLQSKSTRQIAASVALIISLLFVSPEISDQTQQGSLTDMFPKVEQSIVIPTENIISEPKEEKNQKVIEVKNEEPEILNAPVVENKYFIIAASFKQKQPAIAFLNSLKNKGFQSAEMLSAPNGRYRISLQGFSQKDLAVEAQKDYKKINEFSSVWLLTK